MQYAFSYLHKNKNIEIYNIRRLKETLCLTYIALSSPLSNSSVSIHQFYMASPPAATAATAATGGDSRRRLSASM